MTPFKRFAIAAGTAGAVALSLPTPAYAIDQVRCGNTDHLAVRTPSGEFCFANKGQKSIALENPIIIGSGKYSVRILWRNNNGQNQVLNMKPRQVMARLDGSLPSIPLIYSVQIL